MHVPETIGIIGAGVMGRGLCVALAGAGMRVVLVDRTDDRLEQARALLHHEVRTYAILSGTELATDDVLSLTRLSLDLNDLATATLVIENATEKWETKAPIYAQLDRVCPPEAIFAANTSAIPITRLAAQTRRPAQVIGMHFMNPVPLKRTVEVIRGYHTSEATMASAKAFLERIGKTSIVVADSPGFVTNRVMMLTINEAIFLLHEGVATATEIDRLFVQCFGHKMGPLETADLIGLDTVLLSIEVLHDAFKDGKYRPCPLLSKMVDAGLLGRKSGQGFFGYRTSVA